MRIRHGTPFLYFSAESVTVRSESSRGRNRFERQSGRADAQIASIPIGAGTTHVIDGVGVGRVTGHQRNHSQEEHDTAGLRIGRVQRELLRCNLRLTPANPDS